MTTPVEPSGVDQAIKPLRPIFVWALLGYTAIELFFAFWVWLLPGGNFGARSYDARFLGIWIVALPLLAVIISTQIRPVLGVSKLAALVALGEYAFSLLFGVLAFLIGLGYPVRNVDDLSDSVAMLHHVVLSLLLLAMTALAGFAVFRVFTSLGGRFPTS